MNSLVKKFGKKPRWVSWKLETRKGKTTKLPYQLDGNLASSTDPKTWTTYAEIKKKLDNVGIVLSDGLLLCVDMDKILKDGKIQHEKKEMIAEFILSADSYTEVSQSGTGLHFFFELTEKFDLIANKSEPFEIYVSGRYIAVTGNHYGEPKEVRTITPEDMVGLLAIIEFPWGKTRAKTITKTNQPSTREDEVVIKKMFNSKNGNDLRKLFDGDISKYKNDASAADMAFCSYLSFWTGRDQAQIERIWLLSPLGQRKKTVERKDYRDRTIATAIANCKEIYETKSEKIKKENPELDLLYTINREKEKVIVQNTENICRVIRGHEKFAGYFRYDVFKNAYERRVIDSATVSRWRGIEDNDAVDIQTQIQVLFPCFNKVGKDMVYDAILKVSKENVIDSASDYVRSLSWDKKSRLDSWLHHTYGVKEDTYHKAVGSNWIKGLIKRIIEPGCKFDYVLVLEGEQGTKKSTSLSVLGGNWHVETTMSTDSKDFFMQFSGKAIVEFSEGETLSRTEVKRMKAIITTQTDKYRPPYERTSQDFPRRCVFAMTTNQTEYLKDETGNRRWLPVTVVLPEANVEWLAENREQLFAEAYYRVFEKKETIYEFPKDEMIRAQNERRVKDPNADLIVDWYYNKLTATQRENGITIHQVYRDAICGGYVNKSLDRYSEMAISDTLRNVIGIEKKRITNNGARVVVWVKAGSESPDLDGDLDVRSEAEKAFAVLDRS